MAELSIRMTDYVCFQFLPRTFVVANIFAISTDWYDPFQRSDFCPQVFQLPYRSFELQFGLIAQSDLSVGIGSDENCDDSDNGEDYPSTASGWNMENQS